MADLTKEQKEDYRKFFVEKGDPGFNPKRNKAVVAKTIRQYETLRKRKRQDFIDKLGERTDAVATYFKSHLAEGSTSIETYFGKRYLAHLRGQKILARVKYLANKQKVIELLEI